MSRFFGEIRQLGYVVPDIEAAMDYWTRVLGVGPFFYNERVPIQNYRYRGESYQPHNSVALANSGPLQVELIQCRNQRKLPTLVLKLDFTKAFDSVDWGCLAAVMLVIDAGTQPDIGGWRYDPHGAS